MTDANRLRNEFHVRGKLGKDPDMRYAPNGNAYVRFSIAVSMRLWNKETSQAEWATEWFDFVAFGKKAEAIGRLLHKGAFVDVVAEATWHKYVTDAGENRKTLNLTVREFDLLRKAGEAGGSDIDTSTDYSNDGEFNTDTYEMPF